MKFIGRAVRALVCLFVLTALPVLAAPRAVRSDDIGAVDGFSWMIELVQLDEAPADAQERINSALREAGARMIQHCKGLVGPGTQGVLNATMRASELNDAVASIMTIAVSHEAGVEEEAVATVEVLNFDVQTGRQLGANDLFKPSAQDELKRMIRARIAAAGETQDGVDLAQAEIHSSGVYFRNATHFTVGFDWEQVQEIVDFSGPLRAFAPAPKIKVDMALAQPQVDAPTAPPMGQQEVYLSRLEELLREVIPTLSDATKRLAQPEGRWKNIYDADDIIALMHEEVSDELGEAVKAARERAQAEVPIQTDSGEFHEAEGDLIVTTVSELMKGVKVPASKEDYLLLLDDHLYRAITALPVEDKRKIQLEARWKNIYDPEDIVQDLRESVSPRVADAVAGARARALQDAFVDRDAFGEDEGAAIVEAVSILAHEPTGRVVGTTPLELVSANGYLTPLKSLAPGSLVGIETADLDQDWHRVHTADGQRGLLSRKRLLLETPFSDRARVYRVGDRHMLATRVTNGVPSGMTILPLDGPTAQDPTLAKLIELVGPDGMSPPVYFEGIRREIGDRSPWLAVTRFELLEDDGPGIVEHLGGE